MPSYLSDLNDLLAVCAKADPAELPLVDLLLTNIDPNSTFSSSHEPLLAVIIQNFGKYSVPRTFMLAEYIRLFIKHGFNAADFGTSCLYALPDSVQDENLLACAHLLISEMTAMPPADYQMLLDDITQLAAYHEFQTHDYSSQNLLFAYRQLLINTFVPANPRFLGIDHYTRALGQPLLSIWVNASESIRKHLYLTMPTGILIIQNHPNLYLCTSIENDLTRPSALTPDPKPELNSFLARQTLHGISFSYTSTCQDKIIQNIPTIHLHLTDHYLSVTRSTQTGELLLTLDGTEL